MLGISRCICCGTNGLGGMWRDPCIDATVPRKFQDTPRQAQDSTRTVQLHYSAGAVQIQNIACPTNSEVNGYSTNAAPLEDAPRGLLASGHWTAFTPNRHCAGLLPVRSRDSSY